MAAFPAAEIRKLFDIVGNIDRLLLAQAILILIVAGVAIAVSIYNSMSERRREIAILRALGARRATIFSIVLLEAMTICLDRLGCGSCSAGIWSSPRPTGSFTRRRDSSFRHFTFRPWNGIFWV